MKVESEAANKESGSDDSDQDKVEPTGDEDKQNKFDPEQEYEDRAETLLKSFKSSQLLQRSNQVSLKEIVAKPALSRSGEEIQHLMLHLMFKVPFFANFKRKLILALCEKLEYSFYTEGKDLMVEGDIGDKMFILFSGKANVVINKVTESESRKVVVAHVQTNQVVGEKAILEPQCMPRTATVTASSEIHALVLNKKHYDQILYQN